MPRRDGTGPMGQGSMTGRGMGLCGGGFRRGMGFGRGQGQGRRCTNKDEQVALEEEVGILEQELTEAREELSSIKNQKN